MSIRVALRVAQASLSNPDDTEFPYLPIAVLLLLSFGGICSLYTLKTRCPTAGRMNKEICGFAIGPSQLIVASFILIALIMFAVGWGGRTLNGLIFSFYAVGSLFNIIIMKRNQKRAEVNTPPTEDMPEEHSPEQT